jgi:hypothetical protein
MRFLFLFLSFIFLLLNSCKKNESAVSQVFEQVENTGLDFENTVKETKDFNIFTYRNFYNGGGVGVGDINNDGLPDVYFTSNQNKNKLYLNKGNFEFEDITEKAGVGGTKAWSTGVSLVDINADGFLDIYVCNSGDIKGDNKENELFINNGDLTFTEKSREYNLNNQGFSTHAAFFDYDNDGDLDCYILNNSFKNPSKIELYQSMREIPDALGGDKLMRNDIGEKGHPVFTDVTAEAGIYSSAIGFGLGVATGDVNGDNLPDLYISNDFFERDYLYLNQGNGKFQEDLINRLDYTSVSSMGADIADINGDGFLDIFTTDMLPADNDRIKRTIVFDPYHLEDFKYRANYHYQFIQNCLQLNNGKGYFQEIGNLAGVAATDWSWGALIFDFENNGTNDIFVSNGIFKDIMDGDFRDFSENEGLSSKSSNPNFDFTKYAEKLPGSPLQNWAFVNKGDYKFNNAAEDIGLGEKTFSNGSVYADLDADGDLDLLLNNVNQKCSVYRNNSTNNFLKIKFEGDNKNAFGIGAKVKLITKGDLQLKENFTNRGFQSSIEPNLVFGLAENKEVDNLEVVWPDGKMQVIKKVKANQTLVLKYKNAVKPSAPNTFEKKGWYENSNNTDLPISARHVENAYNDFDIELLMHRMLSTESPRLVVGDCNGDGLNDFMLLGATNSSDRLFLQHQNSTFSEGNNAVFLNDKAFESTCGAFLDYDMDGDMDLLIGSGGNQVNVEKINFIVRLYENDGKGNFTVNPNAIPPAIGNFSSIEVSDIDGDGDPDFFLGARVVPGNYGLSPRSYLFRNDRGTWADISSAELGNIGMVTDATWSDYDKDGDKDLIVVGEWMSITIFKNENGQLAAPETIALSNGWWTRIEAEDLDGDGDMDFVVGNWGTNSKFQANATSPLSLFVKDYDGNGKSEPILNWKAPLDKKQFPFASKRELTDQLPLLKKNNNSYEEFVALDYESLFDLKQKEGALNYSSNILETGILWNENGKLTFAALPVQAQFSPIFGISIADFDNDGKKDIWLGGNFYSLKPQVGRLDANKGLLLKGLGNKNFNAVSNEISGIKVKGEVRDAALINGKLVIARNNDTALIFKPSK